MEQEQTDVPPDEHARAWRVNCINSAGLWFSAVVLVTSGWWIEHTGHIDRRDVDGMLLFFVLVTIMLGLKVICTASVAVHVIKRRQSYPFSREGLVADVLGFLSAAHFWTICVSDGGLDKCGVPGRLDNICLAAKLAPMAYVLFVCIVCVVVDIVAMAVPEIIRGDDHLE
jgi:hypothetical protein